MQAESPDEGFMMSHCQLSKTCDSVSTLMSEVIIYGSKVFLNAFERLFLHVQTYNTNYQPNATSEIFNCCALVWDVWRKLELQELSDWFPTIKLSPTILIIDSFF